MRRTARLLLPLCALALSATGCDSTGRTYPEAGPYPEVDVADLLAAAPGRYNTTAYVSAVRVCGPEADCSYMEAIELAPFEDANPPPAVLLAVEASEQFRVGARYVFSVEVGAQARRADREDEKAGPPLTLLGYDRL